MRTCYLAMIQGLTVSQDRGGRTRGLALAPRARRVPSTRAPRDRFRQGRRFRLMRELIGRLPRGRQAVIRLESVRNGDCGRVTSILKVARRRIGMGLFETQRHVGLGCDRVGSCKLWMR